MTEAPEEYPPLERVTGPYGGLYAAAYVVQSGGSFFGYAKICLGAPQDVWDCNAFDKVATPPSTSPEAAMHFAEQRARDLVRALTGGRTALGLGEEGRVSLQNGLMHARALLPTSPAAWLRAACAAMILLLAFAMLDGMGCSAYAQRSAASAPASSDRLYRPAQLVDGRLCTADGACSPAVLVEGVLGTDTIEQLQERARRATPAMLTACFNSPGGTYEAASLAGSLPHNLRTCVADVVRDTGAPPAPALCASACAWTWMAGPRRVIFGANSVGFHAPYEYDAPICVPGNHFKGLLSALAGWWSDRAEGRYDAAMRAARNELRLASLTKGPSEVLPLQADRAVSLGLQSAHEPAATFYATAAGQAVTAR